MVSFGWSQLQIDFVLAKFRIGILTLRINKNIYNATSDHIYLTFASPINQFLSCSVSLNSFRVKTKSVVGEINEK